MTLLTKRVTGAGEGPIRLTGIRKQVYLIKILLVGVNFIPSTFRYSMSLDIVVCSVGYLNNTGFTKGSELV